MAVYLLKHITHSSIEAICSVFVVMVMVLAHPLMLVRGYLNEMGAIH